MSKSSKDPELDAQSRKAVITSVFVTSTIILE